MAFRKSIPYLLGITIAVTIVAAPIWYAWHRSKVIRNFHVVKPGVLYRSGQMEVKTLYRILLKHQIKTVVSFRAAREEGQPPPDLKEESFCRTAGYNYFRIPWRNWQLKNGRAPADQSVKQFIEIMSNPKNYPVLIHCYAGKHRTGAFSAVFRMEFENWANHRAIEEMKVNGYDNIEDHADLYGYLMSYRPGRLRHFSTGEGPADSLTRLVTGSQATECECCKEK